MENDEILQKIATIVDQFEGEDKFTREYDLIRWSRNEYYWKGLQYIFWESSSNTWRVPNLRDLNEFDEDVIDDLLYSKVVNVYKGHGESIIAALSIDVPKVKFFPDDADDPEDVSAAKAYRKMGDMIQMHNKAKLLFMRSLYLLFNQDFVASYCYAKQDIKYGTFQRDVFGKVPGLRCASCDSPIQPPDPTVQEMNDVCPNCGSAEAPIPGEITQQIGVEATPKKRVLIDVYGPLNVKIPPKAQKQENCSYLILELDLHPTEVMDAYPDKVKLADLSPSEDTDKKYRGVDRIYDDKLVTVKRCWLRPSAFNQIGTEEDIVALKAMYPDGCYAVLVNGRCLEARNESMDDHWTISYDPLSECLHSEPLGEDLIDLQDVKNDLMNYTLQTVEYGIPETFADIRALNWAQYNRQKSRHGMVFPARKPSSGSMAENFHVIKTASISREIQEFNRGLDDDAQFVSGDYPSVYGGPAQGSKTLGEYAMSRNQALQRLSNVWTVLNFWWTDTIAKGCEIFKNLISEQGDERSVAENAGNFINSFIRKSELLGKIGNIQPEAAEKFPISMAQKRDTIMELITLNNDMINSVVFDIINADKIASIFGVDELEIPGSEQIRKQIAETQQLSESAPIDQFTPSVPIEDGIDDHEIHAKVLKDYLASFRGQELKISNPMGYMNCTLHLQQHLMIVAAQQAAAAQQEQQMEEKSNVGGTSERGK